MNRGAFYPGLEGLRGVSLLAVLIFHGTSQLSGGFLGVSTFFTLSGFLITGLLVREWEEGRNILLLEFWGRRLRRLLPASLLALLGIAILGPLLADSTQSERLTGDGLSALLYYSNWWLIATGADYDSVMGSASPIQHFWSLSIEEQYYFVYPLLCLACLRGSSGSKHALLGMLLVATLGSWGWMAWLAESDATNGRLYYGTDTRMAELLLGGALALATRSTGATPSGISPRLVTTAGVAGLVITVAAWFFFTVESSSLYQGGLILYTLSSAAIISAAVLDTGPVAALLSSSPLRWLGRISYGAYVYHWPIFLWIDNGVLGLGLTLAVAQVSYQLVEQPVRTGRWPAVGRPLPLAAAATAAVAGSLWIAGPAELPTTLPDAFESRGFDSDEPVRIVVAGDSFARHMGLGLSKWARATGSAEVAIIARAGCGIARGAWLDPEKRSHQSCDRMLADSMPSLDRKFKPDLFVVTTTIWDLQTRKHPDWEEPRVIGEPEFDAWLIEEYQRTVDSMNATGAHVVWLTTPCFEFPQQLKVERFGPDRLRHMNDSILPTLAESRSSGMSIVDLEGAICPNGEFSKSLFGIDDFRPDGLHFSEPGRRWMGNWLGRALGDVVRAQRSSRM